MRLAAQVRKSDAAEPPPGWFWLLPGTVALLRSLPFFWLQAAPPPAGQVYLKLGYIPKDFLSYLAFMRQVADTGSMFLANPFTTEPQSPRFLLLFHWLLGAVASVTGHASWVLELSRVPLAFLFFWVLWRFLGPILPRRNERLWACGLVAFSGGVEYLLLPLVEFLPGAVAEQFRQDTWELFGWNTYASVFNPLWIAALTSGLVCLEPALRPAGVRTAKDLAQSGAGFLVSYLIHPYTAIVLLVVVFAQPVGETLARAQADLRKHAANALGLAVPLAAILALVHWQNQDAVYRSSAAGILGPQSLSVFWYPVTLGLLGWAAARGVALWFREERSYRFAITTWILAVVLLHTSPILNGYKFVFWLHLPICILAAPVVSQTAERLARGQRVARVFGAAALLVLFGQALLLPWFSIRSALTQHAMPVEYQWATRVLAQKPPGHVLAPPDLGNLLPAFTPHRVWVGHWFLTPNFEEKANLYVSLCQRGEQLDLLDSLLVQQQIRYLVLPTSRADLIESRLGSRIADKQRFGRLELLTLSALERRPGSN